MSAKFDIEKTEKAEPFSELCPTMGKLYTTAQGIANELESGHPSAQVISLFSGINREIKLNCPNNCKFAILINRRGEISSQGHCDNPKTKFFNREHSDSPVTPMFHHSSDPNHRI